MSQPKTIAALTAKIKKLKEKLKQAEAKSPKETNFSMAVLNSIDELLFCKNTDGIYLDCNTAFEQFSGFKKSEIVGKKDKDLFNTKDAKAYREGDKKVLQSDRPFISSEWVTFGDGSLRFLETSKALLKNNRNEVIGIIGISRDKTEHETALKTLKESEQNYRDMIEQAADSIFVSDPKHQFVQVNNNACKFTGYSKDELLKLRIEDLISPKNSEREPVKTENLKPGETISKECEIRRKDGTLAFVEVRASLMPDGNLQSILRDISKRKIFEEKLHTSETLNRSVISALREGIVIQYANGEIIDCNESAEDILDLTKEQITSNIFRDPDWGAIYEDGSPFPGESHPAVQTLKTGKPHYNVIMGLKKSACNIIWISINTQPLFLTEEDKPFAVVVSFSDITALRETELELIDSEEKHRLISSISSDYIYSVVLNKDMNLDWVSGAFEEITGYTPDEVNALPQKWVSIIHPDDLKISAIIEKDVEQGKAGSYDYRIVTKENTTRWISDKFAITTDDNNQSKLYGSVKDITKQKEAEEDLLRSNSFIDKIVNTAPSVFYIYDLIEKRNIYINRNIEQLLGFTDEEIHQLNKNVMTSLIHPEDIESVVQHHAKLQDARYDEVHNIQYRMRNKKGEYLNLQSWDRVFEKQENGKTRQIIGVAVDISEQKKAESLLTEAKERYKFLSEATFEGIGISQNGKLIDINNQILNIFGYDREEFLEAGLGKIIHPDDFALVMANLHNNFTEPYEHRGLKKDGSIIHLEARAQSIQVNGEHYRLTVIRDISERKNIERFIRESEERLELTVKGADLGTWDFNVQTGGVVFNERWAEMLGYKLDEIEPNWESWKSRVHPDDLPNAMQLLEEHLAGHTDFMEIEHRMKTKPGEWKWILKRGKVIERDKDGTPLRATGTHLDIDKRKRAETALRNSEAQLSNAMQISQMAYWEYDIRKDLFTFNDRFFSIFRTSVEKIGSYHISTQEYVHRFVHPEDIGIVENEVEKAIITKDPDYSRQIEHRIIYEDGSTGFIVVRFFIEKDEHGKTVRSYGAIQDITQNKQAEEEKTQLEAQLRRSQKMETIGTLAGGIAHDFNNLLTPIMGYTDMALTSLPEDHPLAHDLKQVLIGTNRAKDLVAQILTFSRQIEQEPSILDVPSLIREALKLLRPTIPSTIEIRQSIDKSCGKIYADPSQIHQVLINLCTNAFQAMEKRGGTLSIELKQVTINEATRQIHPNLQQDQYARLTINDTGHGMDDMMLDRIFEPFYSTKPVGKGTGLGLSVVHGIVKSHQGEIIAFSEKGKGSTFHVFLPINKQEDIRENKEENEITGGKESILIVDDEQSVANVLRRMLTQLGYSVDIQTSSLEALNTFKQSSSKYDIIITDLTMPVMDGLQLARELRKIDSDIPVILITGYGDEVSSENQVEIGIHIILAKPIVLVELATAIRKALAAPTAKYSFDKT